MYVFVVQLKLFLVCQLCCICQLPVAGQTRFDAQPVRWELGLFGGDKRPWPNYRHIPQKDINGLGYFIKGCPSEKSPYSRHSGIVVHFEMDARMLVLRLKLTLLGIGVPVHCAELDHAEHLTGFSHSLLNK